MALTSGARLGPYEILAAIGAGGMGEVYKARDTRLDRTVAIKVLPPDVSTDHERRARFAREAKAVGSLNHPHICTLHDVGDHDGSMFLVMELLEGAPLRAQLSRGRLAVTATVDLAIQLADALEAAHDKGIVHRDVKPENVFVTTRDTAKLLDFGIATLVAEQAAATAALTAVRPDAGHAVVGTVAYMSPEQVRGDKLDSRTDLFSLGVVLYEVATGTQPFRGATSGAVMGEILAAAPTAPVRLNPDVPAELERIANKLLEKDRDLRYQSARDVRVDLERLRRTLATPSGGSMAVADRERRSLVVLPFENLSSDPEQEYFCDGMTDEIITALSKIRGLRVISRNSAMTLKGARKTARETGALLNVGHVLEGSVRRAGNNVRISAQLVAAATDDHVWAERYSGTLDDIFTIQDQVAAAIAEALKVTFGPAEKQRSGVRAIADPRARECYRRARHEMMTGTPASFGRAVRLIRQGLDAVGDHPVLQVALAQMHYLALEVGLEPRDTLLDTALDLTRRIQISDPTHAAALLAKLERYTGSQERAIRHFEDAVSHDSDDVESLWSLAWFYGYHAGKPAQADLVVRHLVSVDPLTVMNRFPVVLTRWAEGDLTTALQTVDDIYARQPTFMLQMVRAYLLAGLGRQDAAAATAEAVIADATEAHNESICSLMTAFGHALRGNREQMAATVEGPLRRFAETDAEIPIWVAGWFAMAGDRERALDWLERWADRGSFNYPMLAHGDPFFESVRREPRFRRVLDRVRPTWESFVPRFVPPGEA